MKKQKLLGVLLLSLLFLLASLYSASIFVDHKKSVTTSELVDQQEEHTDAEKETAKEVSNFLLFMEKFRYHLKPTASLSVNYCTYLLLILPEAYTQLHTPPPDLS
jgi:flagellar basal body-associated protein FliL